MVVSIDLDPASSPLKFRALLVQRLYNSKYFFIMYLIVIFRGRYSLREEGHGVLVVSILLRENTSNNTI
jgi:hypothetical protein